MNVSTASKHRLGRAGLAKLAGCNPETLRYYERIGIMPEPDRTAAGYRRYDEADVSRLKFVLHCRELGFTLDEIRGLLDLVDGGEYTCEIIKDKMLVHLEEIRRKIADLRRMERVLKEVTAQCIDGTQSGCPAIELLANRR